MTITRDDPARVYQLPSIAITGATGPVSNITGSTGPTGARAPTGPTGVTGVQGEMGATGPTGASKATGVTGPRGATGPRGNSDTLGPTGYAGDQGLDGPTGNTGPMGRTGAQGRGGGPRGITGTTGLTGTGNVGGTIVPFFGDSEAFLVSPMTPIAGSSSWGYGALASGAIALSPVFVPFARTYTQIVCESQSARLPSVRMRMGIYNCDENMQPTTVAFDSGAMTPIGAGRMSAVMSVALAAKPYYLALEVEFGHNFRALNSAQILPVLGWKRYPPATAEQWSTNIVARNYTGGASFSSPLPDLTGKTLVDSNSNFLIGIR